MAFINRKIPPTEIDSGKLIHRYFVQLAPDGTHLVPGQLQQDEKPAIGQWLELGHIGRDLSARYFVQYTDDNTLVPGSVIQAERFPQGKWKEIKKPALEEFQLVPFSNGNGVIDIHSNFAYASYISDAQLFAEYYFLPILNEIQPGVYSLTQPASFEAYSFTGNFQDFGNDPSKLTPIGAADSPFAFSAGTYTSTDQTGYIWAKPSQPETYYSLVFKILPHGTTPAYYVFLENIVHSYDYPYA